MHPSSSPSTQRRRKKGKRNSSVDNSTTISSSSSSIDSNLDVLTLILTRLAVKSLLVSKSVSKQWYSLISDEPHFVHYYTLQNPGVLALAGLLWYNNHFPKPQNDYISLDGRQITCSPDSFRTRTFAEEKQENGLVKIIQSCNGLLLCSSCTCALDNWDSSCYIYNPFTNKCRILPRSQMRKRGFTYLYSVSLAFDLLKSPCYKVICFYCKEHSRQKYHIEIYSSETSCWKLCGDEYSFPPLRPKSGVFWNGSLNWIFKQGSLFYFDIDREVTADVPRHLPNDGEKWETDYKVNCFDTYEGHLRYVEVSRKASTFNVFHMDIGYTAWNLKYRVDLEGLKVSYPKLCSSGYSVIYVDEGEESPKSVILIHRCRVISYDLKKISRKKLYNIIGDNNYVQNRSGASYNVYKYIESLAVV